MSNSRLVPYVDVPYHPKSRWARKRRSPERSPSTSQTPSTSTIRSLTLSPYKKRRIRRDNDSEDVLSNNLVSVKLEAPVPPTASEFRFNPDSEAVPPTTRSPTPSETDSAREKRRSPSLGALSNSESTFRPESTEPIPYKYDLADDNVDEDEDLLVLGETTPDEDDETELAVRILYDFTVYNADSMEAISVAELLQLDYSPHDYRASGLVKPWVDLDDDSSVVDDEIEDEDDEGGIVSDNGRDRVSLSRILEFNIHSPCEGKDGIDPKIYIRTKFAWYILGTPSNLYRPFFSPFWIRHRLLHLLVTSALDNPRITHTKFLDDLPSLDQADDSVATAEVILGRGLRKEDIQSEDVTTYIISSLPELCTTNRIQISRVPLVREIMGAAHYEFDVDISRLKSKLKKVPTSKPTKHSDKGKKLPKENKTFLTPIVNRLAKNLFESSLEVAESMLHDGDDDGEHARVRRHKGHHSDPQEISWGRKLDDEDEDIYESAIVDGVTYSSGDIVMVEPEPDDAKSSKQNSTASQTVNKYGNRWWFCQIRYFYEESSRRGKTKMFHGIWFSHGSKTILQETSHSKALYLLGTCDNNPITAIFKKCNFKILRPGEEEIVDDGSHDSNDFHCGLLYDDENAAFTDLPPTALAVDSESGCKSCYFCDLQDKVSDMKRPQHPDADTVVLHGITYHVDDFVYLHPSGDTKLLDIGQILKIDDLEVHVQLLGRHDDFVLQQKKEGLDHADLIFDERHLFSTRNEQVVPLHKVDGLCYVRHLTDEQQIERWIQGDDHYYLNQKGTKNALQPLNKRDFVYCKACYQEEKKTRSQAERFMQTNSKLIGMELFCGAGGLGVGMNMSRFVETKYAVEFTPSAAKTYMVNHPDTTVYCQDSSALLKHAVLAMNSKEQPPPLRSLDNKTHCPPLPDKHAQIDFIFGGPPCQSFSFANHSKRRDDVRSTMPANMLSYVEHYEPNYFLLENVFGLLAHKFYAKRETDLGIVESEIQCGMVKFVARTLIALGYQVRYKVLQAAQYGVPQSRRRIIFWGAKRGLPLPDFPIPVYAFQKGMNKTSLPTGDKLFPPTRSKNPDNFHQFAPLRPVTVDASVGDLPAFDWKNPHKIIAATKHDRRKAKERLEDLEIPSFNAELGSGDGSFSSLPGFPEGASYMMEPQNRFQKWVRQEMEDDEEITGQYTTRFSSRIIEATTTVPLVPGADHRGWWFSAIMFSGEGLTNNLDLPVSLLPAFARKRIDRTFYGRMDANGFFKCAVTQLSPMLKNQWPLHPSQKRIITVREAARCQGFPDSYIFESTDLRPGMIIRDQLKQIGNAVAVPFALALGKELGKAMILAWEEKEREGSVPL
ncbi:S-adenosyl-L-methionine-dependent methyltransferase [Flammula alnicola]|nr:S-adenosyl-L-methionine-dependent methyltransferase [Flammula alnicola]